MNQNSFNYHNQHDGQVELLKEYLLNELFLKLYTFDQTTPEEIFPIEPINQDWRNIIQAKDILIEEQLRMNIFKPHVKSHFMKDHPKNDFSNTEHYFNSFLSDTNIASSPKSSFETVFIQEYANIGSIENISNSNNEYRVEAVPCFESFQVQSINPKIMTEPIYSESVLKSESNNSVRSLEFLDFTHYAYASSDVCSDTTTDFEITPSENFKRNPKIHKCYFKNCQSAFSRRHDLKRHSAIHLKAKPYKCFKCDITFSRKDSLLSHRESNKHNCV